MSISKAAQELGRKGGQAKSPAKTAAARANAKKPRGKWVTSVAYRVQHEGKSYEGVAMRRGNLDMQSMMDLIAERMQVIHEVDDGWEVTYLEAESMKV